MFAVITTAKCRLLYSSQSPTAQYDSRLHDAAEPGCRGSQSASAFRTTFYSAVPLPATSNPDSHHVFQTSVPCHHHHHHHRSLMFHVLPLDAFTSNVRLLPSTIHHRRHHHHHAILDCLDIPSSTTTRDDPFELRQTHKDLSPNAAVVGNGQCPGVIATEHDDEGPQRTQPRRQQQCRQRWTVLMRAFEDAFLPASVAALLFTVAVVLCVDAAAVGFEGVARTFVDVDALVALLNCVVEDSSSASIDLFSDLLNAELSSPLCIDRINLDIHRLTSLLNQRRLNVAGMINSPSIYLHSRGIRYISSPVRSPYRFQQTHRGPCFPLQLRSRAYFVTYYFSVDFQIGRIVSTV